MKKIRVFISSVQSEFAEERQILFEYLNGDPLLGRFFEPFVFENAPAIDHTVSSVYLKEVESCDIYLGILGCLYGYEDTDGLSPTEREFDHAVLNHKVKFVFVSKHLDSERAPKEKALIGKVGKVLKFNEFASTSDLKMSVYSTLVRYLEEKEYLRTSPFDATLNAQATIDDIDAKKVEDFVRTARIEEIFRCRKILLLKRS